MNRGLHNDTLGKREISSVNASTNPPLRLCMGNRSMRCGMVPVVSDALKVLPVIGLPAGNQLTVASETHLDLSNTILLQLKEIDFD